jgi:hypothetical protein
MEAINTLARFTLIAVSAITLYVIVMLVVFFLRRRGWLPGGRPTYKSLGSAFLHLQNIAQPDTQYVLEESEKKRKKEEGEGGPDDPTAHLKCKPVPRGN